MRPMLRLPGELSDASAHRGQACTHLPHLDTGLLSALISYKHLLFRSCACATSRPSTRPVVRCVRQCHRQTPSWRRWPRCASLASATRPGLSTRLVQALMPPDCLANQPGATRLQQLSALAGLHARIRQGQPATVCELHVSKADLPEGAKLDCWQSQHSPAGDCAAVVFTSESMWDEPGNSCEQAHTLLLGRSASGEEWSSELPDTEPRDLCYPAFTRCGRYCAVVCDHIPGLGPSEHVTARLFDTAERLWRPEQRPAEDCWSIKGTRVSFAECSGPPLAAVLTGAVARNVLLTFGPSSPEVRVFPAPDAIYLWWVPNTHSVVLLRPDSLALLDVSPSAAASASLAWVSLPATSSEFVRIPQVAFSPQGQAVWVAQTAVADWGDRTRLHLSKYCTSTLDLHGSWNLGLESNSIDVRLEKLAVTHRALAVSCHVHSLDNTSFAFAYKLQPPHQLGPLVLRLKNRKWASLTADCCFALGVKGTGTLAVYDMRTAALVACMQLSGLSGDQAAILAASWSSRDPSQIHVTCSLDGGLRFRVLQF